MRFHVLTLFPEMVLGCLNTSILGRAADRGLLEVDAVNIRDYTLDKHKKVDDYPYGGGAGMLMQAQPVFDAWQAVRQKSGSVCPMRVIYVTPQGKVFNQQMAREFAGLHGHETVYDLYTGTGTIAQFVSGKARKVIGIEYVPEAIADAKMNAANNGITNCEFFAGDMKDVLDSGFIASHGHPDVIILDPPRAGIHPDVAEVILEAAPERIVYVSCNPASQARDLAVLCEKYRITAVQPVDMFPHTHHVENVVALELKQKSPFVLTS